MAIFNSYVSLPEVITMENHHSELVNQRTFYANYQRVYQNVGVLIQSINIHQHLVISCLVGGIPTPLKNDGVRQLSWDDDIPN